MTRKRRIVFSLVAIALTFAACFVVILSIDIYLHSRAERFAGVNIWGYRGPRVARKRPGEHRLVVLGGSTAFGYGTSWDKAFPAQLEAHLGPLARNGAPVSVVNLGMNNQGAYAFKFGLEDYLSLDYDAALLYEGYNDHMGSGGPNYYVGRRDSPVFRLVGYYPIFPVIFREKAYMLRSGSVNAGYLGDKTVFRPTLANRASATALETAARVGQSLDEQLERYAKSSAVRGPGVTIRWSETGCSERWKQYCGAVYDAIQFALAHAKKVLVVTQPYLDDDHRSQQEDLRGMLKDKFGGNPNVGYANMGDVIDIDDKTLVYDRMHLNDDGNARIARHLVAPVATLMPDAFTPPR